MSTLEVEVKLEVRDAAAMPGRLSDLGARLLHPREFEDNRLYDFPDRGLVARGAMLRVRETGRATFLTFKDRARSEGGVKVREEIEADMPVSEAAPLVEILQRLGMQVIFRYQKYRTTWQAGELHITLDETPIGVYLELEGERPAIDAMAARLGYGPADYIAQSYRDLYLTRLTADKGPSDRMLFPDRGQVQG